MSTNGKGRVDKEWRSGAAVIYIIYNNNICKLRSINIKYDAAIKHSTFILHDYTIECNDRQN